MNTTTTDQPKTKVKAAAKDEPETRTLKELFINQSDFDKAIERHKERLTALEAPPKTTTDQQPLTVDAVEEGNKTKQVIKEEFGDYSNYFKNQQDLELFYSLLTNYFEQKPCNLPTVPIILKKGSKTNIAKVFNPLYKKLSEAVLKHETGYFSIIRVLSPFQICTDSEIYKAITR